MRGGMEGFMGRGFRGEGEAGGVFGGDAGDRV